MKRFIEWLESHNYVVTFDFDSTLTRPFFDVENETWETVDEPNEPNVQMLRREASGGANIFIVSSRQESERRDIELL
jgi:hypothetical protein